MKLTEIHVDQFGVWKDLDLKLNQSGLTVMYGPNETGKSTLMKFLRGMFFGFESENQEGSISIFHEGKETALNRKAFRNSKNRVSLSGSAQNLPHEKFLDSVLGGVDQHLFESVYAIGLEEIQKLGTLQKEEVSKHIFGSSLGPEGEALLKMSEDLDRENSGLYDRQADSGRIRELLKQEKELLLRKQEIGTPREKQESLRNELARIKKELEDLKKRESGMKYQLRGHEFLKRVYEPWVRVNDLKKQIKKIPDYPNIPSGTLEKIIHIDEELRTLRNKRLEQRKKLKSSGTELRTVSPDSDVKNHLSLMKYFVSRSDWQNQKQSELGDFQSETKSLNDRIQEKLGESSDGEDLALSSFDEVNPANHFEIMKVAESYRQALARRSRLGKRYKSLSKKYNHLLASLENSDYLEEGETASVKLEQKKAILAQLEQLRKEYQNEREQQQKKEAFLHQMSQFDFDFTLPAWARGVLTGCVLAGIFFVVWGLFSKRDAGWIEGISYALLGITCGSLVWGIKSHFDSASSMSHSRLDDEIRKMDLNQKASLKKIEELKAGIKHESGPEISDFRLLNDFKGIETLIHQVKNQIGQLETDEKTEQRIGVIRKRLSRMRIRLKSLQAELGEARQSWCVQLKNSGLKETVNIQEGLDQWNLVQEMTLLKNHQRALEEKQIYLAEDHTRFESDIHSLWKKVNGSSREVPKTESILADWQKELEEYDSHQEIRDKLSGEYRDLKKQVRELTRQISSLTRQRRETLKKVGVRSKPQLERRIKLARERDELKLKLKEADTILESISRSETEMAIVEEDLVQFQPEENQESIDVLTLELEEIEKDLQKSHERKGSLLKEFSELENDRSHSRLIYQQLKLRKELKSALEDWTACQVSRHAGNQIKKNYEKNYQPEILAKASGYLEELTSGKYHNIWTQLGQNDLCVDDHENHERQVHELSRGTCEQLLLAVRLATIDQFREKGVELPLLMDDVMVNYDQQRTESAVDTLIRYSNNNQQVILLTCHLHLAEMFARKGIEPVWLQSDHPFDLKRKAG